MLFTKIFINPGHSQDGKPDPGALNKSYNLREAIIAREIGSYLEKILQNAMCDTELLQSDNLWGESPGPEVIATANESEADIFGSIHCNASQTGEARGCETLCYQYEGRGGLLADCIQHQLYQSLGYQEPGFIDRGVKERPDLAVLKGTIMPAVLVETAFIDNDEDALLLMFGAFTIAAAIARGITDYWVMISNMEE